MSLPINVQKQPCRSFTMTELSSATDNFDEKWCIGHGGFGKVYKGKMISDGPNNETYAIKRAHDISDQGEPEFLIEVEMLSRLRHCNLVSLIGYCNEEKEMALVYEYMKNGTLYDHLHKKGTVFTWSQLLKICIGAARGLDYLHTGSGTQQGVIHRDVKSTNILLDQNYAAKIADFGLAKIGPTNQTNTYVSTAVKGTFGYMDPNYFYTGRLTRKSDVYAFGVVLLEVLSGRRALDQSLDVGLVIWAQELIKRGKLNQVISSSLRNQILKSSLKEFSRIVVGCLHSYPDQRPTMSEIVGSLHRALSFQEKISSSAMKKVWSLFSLKDHSEVRSSKEAERNEINVSTVISGEQDENQSKSNTVTSNSYLIPLINTPASILSSHVETATGNKESIRIFDGENRYSDSSSLDGSGSSGVEFRNNYMYDHCPSQEGENNTRYPASNINTPGQVQAEQIKLYQPGGVYKMLKTKWKMTEAEIGS